MALLAPQQGRERRTHLLPGEPVAEDRIDVVDPRHLDRGAAVEHDDGVVVRRRDGFDQRVTVGVEAEIRGVGELAGTDVAEHDGDIGLGSRARMNIGQHLARFGQ